MRTMEIQSAPIISGYSGGRRSPIGISGTIAVHALVVGTFLLMPKEMIDSITPSPFIIHSIPLDPPPPENPPPPDAKKPKSHEPASQPATTDPFVPTASNDWPIKPIDRTSGDGTGDGGLVVAPPDPPRPPVLVDAQIDPRALPAFQPDYPGAMIRQQVEGSVTVRVTIGTDGRVVDIERVSATDESFWLATQRHALRKWRFRPATRDGVPVTAIRVLTVHFRLEDR
ncbi:energy transducer TonB [Sphingobium sp. AN558]|uniref:energy transducer TonB n=1 Tax=Sphingobium sp. AN558 TaxID=3133442 RepID=UPI0030BE0CCF